MTTSDPTAVATFVGAAEAVQTVNVKLSNELVSLLSEQLYQSPLKAIEELVINSYDADASVCRVYVPDVSEIQAATIAVYDDGVGMNVSAMSDLWHIGRSDKRTEAVAKLRKRKQIGKFGIGKLATYAVANQITYISRTDDASATAVTLDFRSFKADPTGAGQPVPLRITRVKIKSLTEAPSIIKVCKGLGVNPAELKAPNRTWTLVVLEALKPKASSLHMGRLRQVLRTAMPLQSSFALYLNQDAITSSKADLTPVVQFRVGDIQAHRVTAISEVTGQTWLAVDGTLVSDEFPSGLAGHVLVTAQTLTGKSDDLGRSSGFFVRVRGRLINEEDHLFGLPPLSHTTMARFRADVAADDLDEVITAPREGVLESKLKVSLQRVLRELFNEARDRYEGWLANQQQGEKNKTEEKRNFVNPRLVEFPLADVVASQDARKGAEADDSWFYLDLPADTDLQKFSSALYSSERKRYTYDYAQAGRNSRLVRFYPLEARFVINEDHDLAAAYSDDGRAAWLLEDFATAEALLEIYLREHGVSPETVGDILEQRDALLRSFAQDHPYSLTSVAQQLSDSASDEHDLELAIVAAARSLGFVAKHVSGAGEPDGLARFTDYETGEKTVTLEAKSSKGTPSLAALDFAGLQEHVKQHSADGCLLVAPAYPAAAVEASATANRANELRISCWTVKQLVAIVAAAESRQISARHVLKIVLGAFAPLDVSAQVEKLLSEPSWAKRDLYREILSSLRRLHDRLPGSLRSVDMVASEVTLNEQFKSLRKDEIEEALRDLSHASQGLMTLRDEKLLISGDLAEISRRLNGLVALPGDPRRIGTFRESGE